MDKVISNQIERVLIANNICPKSFEENFIMVLAGLARIEFITNDTTELYIRNLLRLLDTKYDNLFIHVLSKKQSVVEPMYINSRMSHYIYNINCLK